MKIENNFVERLIDNKNPFPTLWKYMTNNVWRVQEDIESFYGQESQMKDFELFLNRVFDEIYTKLLPKYCTGKGYKIELENPVIFLDSLSIREGILLQKSLDDNGIDSELTYSFSSIPSGTKYYKKKIEFDKLTKKGKFAEIKNFSSWNLDGDEKIIWSDFPDARLESLSKGKTILGTVTQTYKEIEELILEILDKLESERIEVMSDHGYVRHQGAYTFQMNKKDQKKVKDVLGGKRYAPKSDVGEIPEGMENFLVQSNNYCVAKGRYVWPVSGKYSKLQHGGVSLIECMTPRLTIER